MISLVPSASITRTQRVLDVRSRRGNTSCTLHLGEHLSSDVKPVSLQFVVRGVYSLSLPPSLYALLELSLLREILLVTGLQVALILSDALLDPLKLLPMLPVIFGRDDDVHGCQSERVGLRWVFPIPILHRSSASGVSGKSEDGWRYERRPHHSHRPRWEAGDARMGCVLT